MIGDPCQQGRMHPLHAAIRCPFPPPPNFRRSRSRISQGAVEPHDHAHNQPPRTTCPRAIVAGQPEARQAGGAVHDWRGRAVPVPRTCGGPAPRAQVQAAGARRCTQGVCSGGG
eukprot:269076-Chlamydomonas_euryale.AAC.2